MKNDNFIIIIQDLITLKTEGDYWDFKQKWHDDNGKLLHDIICMANNLTNRDGYIIFGITDSDKEVVGVPETNRKNQQNIIDFLKNKKFAGGIRPTVYVKSITIDKKELDILIVRNDDNTPYYLTERYKDVSQNNIYTRIGDTNTPVNTSADIDKVEYLWKKRFGLNLLPFEKVQMLIKQPNNWKRVYIGDYEKTMYHNITFPEFTITIESISDNEEMNMIKEPNHFYFYLFAATGVKLHPNIFFKWLIIRYHSTVLYSKMVVFGDEGNYNTVPFETDDFNNICYDYQCDYKLSSSGKGKYKMIFAYRISDSIDSLVNTFLQKIEKSELDKSVIDNDEIEKAILFFDNEEEKNRFVSMINSNQIEFIKRFENINEKINMPKNNYKYDITMSLKGAEILVDWLSEWRSNA
jgi:hypothetical protein